MMLAEKPPSSEPDAPVPKPAQAKSTASLTALRKMFDDWQTLTQDARAEDLIDQDYVDGKQWTAEERRILKSRKQPDNVFNRVRPAIYGTLGVIKQGASDPRAFPRNPDDQDSADVASKTLRYIADQGRFATVKIDVATNYLINGTGAVIVEVDGDKQIISRRIRWEEFFYDPRSRERDFCDARYLGVAKWMYADDVGSTYPNANIEALMSGGGSAALDRTLQDRPLAGETAWVDGRKRRLLVCEIYFREGGAWMRAVFHASAILESGPSPYLDHKGRPCCPIEAQSCYIDSDNNRYGLVRDMRGPQDEINKRRSKLLHLLNTRQVQENQSGAMHGVDADLVRKEAARPDGVLPSGVQIVPTSDMADGQANLLAEAKSEIERMGPNPAILGRQGENQSGRATLVRQQAGLTEQAVVLGGIEEWELRVYRQMWARAKQYWTGPDYVRVTDDQKAPQFVAINQPIMGPPQVVHVYDDTTGQTVQQVHQPILGYQNSLAEMDVDIILDTTPDTANLQQEQFQALVDLARSGVPIPPQVLLEASSLPNKREIVEKLKAMEQQSSQTGDPVKELAVQKTQAEIGTEIAKGQEAHSQALLNLSKAAVNVAPPAPEPGWLGANPPPGPDMGPGPQMAPQGPPQPPPGPISPMPGAPGPDNALGPPQGPPATGPSPFGG